jgi:hypothetical protein
MISARGLSASIRAKSAGESKPSSLVISIFLDLTLFMRYVSTSTVKSKLLKLF